jgi:hypothetical protein
VAIIHLVAMDAAVAAAASGWQGYTKTAGTESSAAYEEYICVAMNVL